MEILISLGALILGILFLAACLYLFIRFIKSAWRDHR